MSQDAIQMSDLQLVPVDDFTQIGQIKPQPPAYSSSCGSQKPLPPLAASAFMDKPIEELATVQVKKAMVIMNPHSGNQRAQRVFDRVKPIFQRANIELDVKNTERPRHATDIAREANFEGYDALLVIGGDGTFNETVNGILTRAADAGPVPPLGLIPGGTGNSLTVSFGTEDPDYAAEVIVKGKRRHMDAGKITMGDGKVVYMVNLLGWGLGVDANTTAESLRCCGPCRYDMGAVWQIILGKERQAKVVVDGHNYDGDYSIIMVQNNAHGGAHLNLAPFAKVDDGCMDVLLARNVGRGGLLGLFDALKAGGSHVYMDSVVYRRFKKLSIGCAPNETLINVDGENIGTTPVTLEVVPKAFDIFAAV